MLLRRTALPPTLAADGGELRQAAGIAAAVDVVSLWIFMERRLVIVTVVTAEYCRARIA